MSDTTVHDWPDIAENPKRVYKVAGVHLSEQDLLTAGEMLEAEQSLGTSKAAAMFATANPFSRFGWGSDDGGGNVLLPLRKGGTVDIDWLNIVMTAGGVTPNHAALAYLVGKVSWSVFHGIRDLSYSKFRTHLRQFGAKDEEAAVELAGQFFLHPWKFSEILHPDLVSQAGKVLASTRALIRTKAATRERSRPIRPRFELTLPPKEPHTLSPRVTKPGRAQTLLSVDPMTLANKNLATESSRRARQAFNETLKRNGENRRRSEEARRAQIARNLALLPKHKTIAPPISHAVTGGAHNGFRSLTPFSTTTSPGRAIGQGYVRQNALSAHLGHATFPNVPPHRHLHTGGMPRSGPPAVSNWGQIRTISDAGRSLSHSSHRSHSGRRPGGHIPTSPTMRPGYPMA